LVTVPGGGVGVTLHATEVTRCQYAKFLETNPTQTANLARCAWNEDFAADPACSALEDYYAGAGSANHPQTCVDWCDAAEYCQHVGMRLCGAKAGGPLNESMLEDPTADQYFDACSSFGAHNYPYGGDPAVSSVDGFLPDACNGNEHVLYETLPVAFLSTCQSSVDGYEGIFDLSGNASEWVDMCTEGALPEDDVCHARGGSFADNYGKQRCVDYSTGKRSEPSVYFGFRCCE
jgi:formylglycine-generating enzyme required for sulfatase activity